MTTGLKTPSNYYFELINTFPPRPITNEDELIATQNRINFLLDRGKLTQDERDYLKVLGVLVYDYEEKYEPLSELQTVEMLQALLEEANLQPKDLVGIFENESIVLKVLKGNRKLTELEIRQLADFFQISTELLTK